jgi:hypothetical protein
MRRAAGRSGEGPTACSRPNLQRAVIPPSTWMFPPVIQFPRSDTSGRFPLLAALGVRPTRHARVRGASVSCGPTTMSSMCERRGRFSRRRLGNRPRVLALPPSRVPPWNQGNCAATCCTKSASGHAAAKARIYFRLRGDSASMSTRGGEANCARGLAQFGHASEGGRARGRQDGEAPSLAQTRFALRGRPVHPGDMSLRLADNALPNADHDDSSHRAGVSVV